MSTFSRKLRRQAVRGLPTGGDELAGLEEVSPLTWDVPPRGLLGAFRGTQISVQIYSAEEVPGGVPVVARISVRRHDGTRLREHWRTLFRLKEFLYPGHVAFEVHPPLNALIDDAPMWHLWVLEQPAKLGVSLGRMT